jgi:hypothetical protein
MSLQSESGRLDYDKSDHAPKGTRVAGDVVDKEDYFLKLQNTNASNRGKYGTGRSGPKAPVIPISPTAERNNPAFK